jgi:hypothetical protein
MAALCKFITRGRAKISRSAFAVELVLSKGRRQISYLLYWFESLGFIVTPPFGFK